MTQKYVIVAMAVCALANSSALGEPRSFATNHNDEASAMQVVGYSDLDLTSADGERVLKERVKSAVRTVCNNLFPESTERFAVWDCRLSTWHETYPQIRRAVTRSRELAASGLPRVAVAEIVVRSAE